MMKKYCLSVLAVIGSLSTSNIHGPTPTDYDRTYEAIIYNNSNSPVFVWPIPTYAPPRVLARVPSKREGGYTAPARLGWPTPPKSIVVVAEPLLEDFNKMLDEMFAEAAKVPQYLKYDWTGEISRRLEAKPKTQWVMIYKDPPLFAYKLTKHVIYNETTTPTPGSLWPRTDAGNLWVHPYGTIFDYGY